MVQGDKINEITVGGVTVSVWKAEDPPKNHHDDFKVEIGKPDDDDWVCVGGGGTAHSDPGQYFTASFPSDDFKSWNIHSRDHLDADNVVLTGYAIGMKIPDLTKAELVENLHIFKDLGPSEHHPDRSCFVDNEFSMLVGGGFEILDQPNLATGSFPDSNISWRANSKDHDVPCPSSIRVFAIGIRPTIKRGDDSIFGDVVTMYHSFEQRVGDFWAESRVGPLPGMALCGGGGASHWYRGMLLWALEPTTKAGPIVEADQSFTAKSKNGTNWFSYDPPETPDYSTVTAYAMGIKFKPSSIAPPITPPCDQPIAISDVTSCGDQEGFPSSNAIDNNPNTKWLSILVSKPWIRFGLGGQKKVCRVDITWAWPVRETHFDISVSTGGGVFTDVLKDGVGIVDTVKYNFPHTVKADMIEITITKTGPSSPPSEAQIADIQVFGPA